jgi:hypothetical protein
MPISITNPVQCKFLLLLWVSIPHEATWLIVHIYVQNALHISIFLWQSYQLVLYWKNSGKTSRISVTCSTTHLSPALPLSLIVFHVFPKPNLHHCRHLPQHQEELNRPIYYQCQILNLMNF